MTKIKTFAIDQVRPDRDSVLELQGIPKGAQLSPPTEALLRAAMNEFSLTAQPIGLIKRVSAVRFRHILHGPGQNERDNPVQAIFPKANDLMLFAVTLGPSISDSIRAYFEEALEKVNSELPAYERIGSLLLVRDPWSVDSGEMTPTLKIKRKVLEEHYADRFGSNKSGVLMD